MLILTFSPLVSWPFSAATVFHHSVGCMLGVENSFLSMCMFRSALVVVLKFIAILKGCKYLYQLISGEVRSVIHLPISLNDEQCSYQLSSIQACWPNLYLCARKRHLCVQVMLPCTAILCHVFQQVDYLFAGNHCWNLLSPEGLVFLFWCPAECLNSGTTLADFKMLLTTYIIIVSSHHIPIVLGMLQIYNAQNVFWKVLEVLCIQFDPVNWCSKETM